MGVSHQKCGGKREFGLEIRVRIHARMPNDFLRMISMSCCVNDASLFDLTFEDILYSARGYKFEFEIGSADGTFCKCVSNVILAYNLFAYS